MNREILFKAKRICDGCWAYGNLVWSNDADKEYRSLIIPKENSGIFSDSEEDEIGFEVWHLVKQDTICEYTGLEDRNGNRIFEFDIVRRYDLHGKKEPSVGFIEYNEENASFFIHWTRAKTHSPIFPWKDKIEVIGNIFDNTGLLKGDVME